MHNIMRAVLSSIRVGASLTTDLEYQHSMHLQVDIPYSDRAMNMMAAVTLGCD
jgi:hypothetical protein